MRCPGGRTAAGAEAGEAEVEISSQRENAAAIDMGLDEIGDRLEPRFERLGLPRLHETQMALGQGDALVARQHANDGHANSFDRLDDEPTMAVAGDAIDDDARNFQPIVISCAALDDRRRRLRLTRHIDDQQDRHAERRRDVSRGAGAPGCRGNAVEQPHRGFAQSERTWVGRLPGEGGKEVGGHRPGIEVDALPPRGCGMKCRVDIVGAGLETDHVDAAGA